MKFVVDANILINASLEKLSIAQFKILLENDLYAPSIIIPEVGNGLWKYVQFDNLDVKSAIKLHENAISFIDEIIVDLDLVIATFKISSIHNLSFYDALYLALAQNMNAPLISFDKKLTIVAKDLNLLLDF